LIISGLDLISQNQTKTVYLDVILNGTGVCIKDLEILNITEISSTCNGIDEYFLKCPGIIGSYNCTLIENNTKYMISGLAHSGIIETTIFCGDGIVNGDETRSTCPADVGACSVAPPASSGGGGGGGGGGAAPITAAVVANETNNTTNETLGRHSIIEEESNSIEETESNFAPITGAVIGTNIKNSAIISSIFIFIICSTLLFVLRAKDKSDKKKTKKKKTKKKKTKKKKTKKKKTKKKKTKKK